MTLPGIREHSGLLTDLYELTMAAGYLQTGFDARASFELFVRRLPPRRDFLVAAGLDQALGFAESVKFSSEDVEYLRRHPTFRHVSGEFFDYLTRFRFSGDIWAIPEGSIVFAGEPLLRVTAPVIEAQILETHLLSAINFQTMIASRAARVFLAAKGRPVVEFGARRAHGTEAGIFAARASWIAGCEGTSNVFAGHRFDIPTYGTQAHSWIMAFENESEAFGRFLDVFPEHATLLVDTYNVRGAIKKIIARGRKPAGVRLDSGNLVADSRWAREQLKRAGWNDVQIFASGDLDEHKITKLLRQGAQIDAFGVGSALVAPIDAPNLGMIYKLVEIERGGRVRQAAKLSEAKATYPGRKQVFRFSDSRGKWKNDLIALADESYPDASPQLVPLMRGGRRLAPTEPLAAARLRFLESVKRLPLRLLSLSHASPFLVLYSKRLKSSLAEVRRRVHQADSLVSR
ncbi:MAG TPA: nicotinate phosphoribosyltransferase [Candidatus Acidoferrales bacterium]|nr:nicotinate phosphoribosyltransferase [Candidatus Acidoferrales bacterium]